MKADILDDLDGNSLEDMLTGKALQEILRQTIDSIENSKGQIFDIYEWSQAELETSKKQLEDIQRETRITVDEVDALVAKEQREKQSLVRVSSNFSEYSEEKIKETYESVKEIQIKLGIAKEKERQLRQQRDRMELRLFNLQKTVMGAQRLAMKIGSVLGYLRSNISDVVAQMEQASKNKVLSAAIIKAQEEERLRVSREIHDGPAQEIANVMFQASVCERMIDIDSDEAKSNLQDLRRQLRVCLTEIRQIIFEMRPMSLDDLGLCAAIKQLAIKLRERHTVSAEVQIDGKEIDLPDHVETAIFRIVQESLNNVSHHSGVKEAEVKMLFAEDALSVLISDNGKGFDPEAAPPPAETEETESGHFGMLGMKERANIIGAQLSVISKIGEGTKVHLRLPLTNLRLAKNTAEMREEQKKEKAAQKTAAPAQKAAPAVKKS